MSPSIRPAGAGLAQDETAAYLTFGSRLSKLAQIVCFGFGSRKLPAKSHTRKTQKVPGPIGRAPERGTQNG